VNGYAHFQGFAQILTFPDQTAGIEPVFKLSQGLLAWPKPPCIDPTFGNNGSVDWCQGKESKSLTPTVVWFADHPARVQRTNDDRSRIQRHHRHAPGRQPAEL
jgi:hypothetical protein